MLLHPLIVGAILRSASFFGVNFKETKPMSRTLIPLARVGEKTCTPVATLRYWRHIGEGPPLFALGKRIVGYEDEIDEWILSQAEKDRNAGRQTA